jgi:nucleotide-binding universal stress UspA family protein
MNRILVPMDLTEVSVNAFAFANQLFPQDQLVIVHVAPVTINLNTPKMANSIETYESSLIKSVKAYIQATLKLKSWPTRAQVTVLQGEPISVIKSFAQTNKFDYAVLGTRDNHNLADRWIGTISLGLVKQLEFPVYLIPRYSSYHKFDRIVVASDSFQLHKDLIPLIRRWIRDFKAYIKFLHVQEDVNSSVDEECRNLVESILGEEEPGVGFEIVNVGNNQISKTLLATAYNFKADLLITSAKHQSFLESLMVLSLSKELIDQAWLPVLFFNKD